jgi:hypothetical protein
MVWLTRVGLLAIVGAMGCAPPCLDAHVVAGASPSSSDLRPGTYHIVMRVISGPHAGKHTTGSLWLAPTSPGDRSAKTKKGPATTFGYNPRARLYGSITLDFTRIGISPSAKCQSPIARPDLPRRARDSSRFRPSPRSSGGFHRQQYKPSRWRHGIGRRAGGDFMAQQPAPRRIFGGLLYTNSPRRLLRHARDKRPLSERSWLGMGRARLTQTYLDQLT